MKNPNAIVSSDFGPIIINTNDTFIGKSIGQYGYWALDDIKLILALIDIQLKKLDKIVFYDVGANIGTHSLAVAKTYQDKVKIRAFEAQRQIYHMLCGTMAINGIANINCHHCAISDIDGADMDIDLPDYNEMCNFAGLELIAPVHSYNQDVVKTATDRIKTVSIDSFSERVDFIKMDIEGMEDKALRGADATMRIHRPICFVELVKTDRDFVLDYFRNLNYRGFYKNESDLVAVPAEHGIKLNGLQQLI